eukprot:TRINITY_DN2112_c0_g1_i2.p1 TRINITY_DN2112_c0_g1~~TRINITY_DN2112_c0_g1_i2.p1  ORF type:complete len:533 (+),score=113.12 TRINITY_DN2112_c0_g1_i2:314-1912(+)
MSNLDIHTISYNEDYEDSFEDAKISEYVEKGNDMQTLLLENLFCVKNISSISSLTGILCIRTVNTLQGRILRTQGIYTIGDLCNEEIIASKSEIIQKLYQRNRCCARFPIQVKIAAEVMRRYSEHTRISAEPFALKTYQHYSVQMEKKRTYEPATYNIHAAAKYSSASFYDSSKQLSPYPTGLSSSSSSSSSIKNDTWETLPPSVVKTVDDTAFWANASPDDELSTIPNSQTADISFFWLNGCFTIRDLCDYVQKNRVTLSSYGVTRNNIMNQCVNVVSRHLALSTETASSSEPKLPKATDPPVYVYHYANEEVYNRIQQSKMIKSPYVLFHEYLQCSKEEKKTHPWRRVFQAYQADAARWVGTCGKNSTNLTDTDVYSFLVWRSSSSFAANNCTAGPRAIYFTWTPMPPAVRENAIAIDRIVAEDSKRPYVADRFLHEIKINLTHLVSQNQNSKHNTRNNAVVYRVDRYKDSPKVDTNHWLETRWGEITELVKEGGTEWANFEAGETYFGTVPHGCIVMDTGTVPIEAVEL